MGSSAAVSIAAIRASLILSRELVDGHSEILVNRAETIALIQVGSMPRRLSSQAIKFIRNVGTPAGAGNKSELGDCGYGSVKRPPMRRSRWKQKGRSFVPFP